MSDGFVYEGYTSIQGEGKYAGKPQFFLRLAGCSLKCRNCDTKYAWKVPKTFVLKGYGTKKTFYNPVNPEEIGTLLNRWRSKNFIPPSIAITGGEPAEQFEFVKPLLKTLKNFEKLFETNGLYPYAVKGLLPLVDIFSVDIKLPSFTGKKLDLHRFLKTISFLRKKDAYIKIVFTGTTKKEEIEEVLSLLATSKINLPVFLQPSSASQWKKVLKIALIYSANLDVRILPQVHKLMNIK